MKALTKLPGFLLAMVSMLGSEVLAYLPPINFESPEFVPYETVNSQPDAVGNRLQGWDLISGQATVAANGAGAGSSAQALQLGQNAGSEDTHLRRAIAWDGNEEVAFIDFMIRPPANPAGSQASIHINGSQIAFQASGTPGKGELWVYHGNDDAADPQPAEDWLVAGTTFDFNPATQLAASYHRVTLRQDAIRRVWDVFVDGKLVAVNLGFEARGPLLQALDFFGSDMTDVLIDDLSANPENMLFADADKDGLPDAWETAHGSDPAFYDRDEINPATGKSWLDDYLDSLWPPQGPGGVAKGGVSSPPLGVVPPLAILGLHQPVGALKGSLTVAGDGSAAYSIPIDIPKGTAGMEPKLSLDYSSNGTNGVAGLGWSLTGLQQISRGGATHAKDGFVDGVDFDGNDRFFFNGERLVLVSGTYGADGSEYRTEMDSFARIIAVGQNGSGPASWTVQTKAGLKLILGGTADSRVGDTRGVISWSVNRVEDTVGNYYSVTYTRDAPDPDFPEEVRNQRVFQIKYTGNDGLIPYCSIDFVFESRPDLRSFYTIGLRQVFDKRLSEIVVSTGNYENHRYELDYFQSGQTGRSLLHTVTKVAGGQAIPPTVFEWQTTGHDDPKWQEVGEFDIQEYGSGLDSSGNHPGYLGIDADGTELHLTGATWRTLPITYAITPDTILDFEYRANPLPGYAMIGLDVDLSTSGASQLVKLVGGNSPPAPVAGSDLYTPAVSGAWQRKQIPAGSLFTNGQVSHLVLISHDITPSDGEGESWFRNVRIYENGTDPDTVGPLTFDANVIVPRLTAADKDEIGWTFADLNGDGWSDLLRREFHSLGGSQWGGPAPIGTYGQNMLGSSNGFNQLGATPEDTVLMTGIEEGNNKAFQARRLGLVSTYTDLNADGRVEACVVADPWRVNTWNYRNEHAFICLDGDDNWIEQVEWRLPFYSQCNINYNKFDDFAFQDLDGDGFPDLSADTGNGGRLYDTTTGQQVGAPNGTYAWLNRVNDGGGWVAAPEFAAPMASNTGGLKDRRYMDVNSDGLVDFVRANSYYGYALWLNNGSGWEQQPVGSALQMPVGFTNGNGDDIGTRTLDLNGDGMTDIIKDLSYGGVNYPTSVFMGTGTGWEELDTGGGLNWFLDTNFTTFDKYDETHQNPGSLVDINVDGLVDFVHAKYNSNFTYINTGSGWWKTNSGTFWADGGTVDSVNHELPVEMYASAWGQYAGKATARFSDLNGDGAIDYIADIHTARPRVFLNLRGPEVIESITDGFGKTLGVEYARINDPTPLFNSDKPVYTPHDPASDPALPDGHVAINGPGYVVSRLLESDGLGGIKCTRRHYGDLRFDRNNQTSLGFGWVEVHDEYLEAGTSVPVCRGYTRTTFKREFPYAGSPEVVHTYAIVPEDFAVFPAAWSWPNPFVGISAGEKLVGLEMNSYGKLGGMSGLEAGPPSIEAGPISIQRPVQTSSVVLKLDIDDNQTVLSQVTTIQDGIDAYGFVTHSTVTALDGSKTETSSDYDHYDAPGGKWLLGRLSYTTVEKTGGSSTIKKRSEFGYAPSSGLLTTEKIVPLEYDSESSQWNPVVALEVLTTYFIDDLGNTWRTTKTAGGETRWSESGYDPQGRFVTSETTALGTVQHHYSPAQALLLATTDIDGRVTTFTYDSFGTQIAANPPNGTRSAEITRFASNYDLPSVIAGKLAAHNITIQWARIAQTSGEPESIVWFDTLGREVVTRSTVMVSSAPTFAHQYAYKLYDSRGRVAKESAPFMVGDPIYETEYLYDFLDRKIATKAPDGTRSGITSIGRNATTGNDPLVVMTAKNPKGVTSTRWDDQHGRLRKTTDASNQVTEFFHDVEGLVTSVEIDGVVQLTNTYDVFGNKTKVLDVSAGESESTYNGFGEVLTSTNALNQTTTTTYDALGRVTSVERPEGTYYHYYRPNSPNKGKLETVTSGNGYIETYTYGEDDHNHGLVIASSSRLKTGEPIYSTGTSYNCLGLPTETLDAGGAIVRQTYDSTYGSFALRSHLISSSYTGAQETLLSEVESVVTDGTRILTTERLAHDIIRKTWTNATNGYLREIQTTGIGRVIQHHTYDWDDHGNLTQRKDELLNKTETFTYDSLDRLTGSTLIVGTNAPVTRTYGYDDEGNLIRKGDETTASTGNTHTYTGYQAMTATLKGRLRTQVYDAAGRVTSMTYSGTTVRGTSLQWTSFNQLKRAEKTSAPALVTFGQTTDLASQIPGIAPWTKFNVSTTVAEFDFDASGNRARQTLTRTFASNQTASVTTRYLGSYEHELHDTTNPTLIGRGVDANIHRHRLGSALLTHENRTAAPSGPLTVTRLAVVLTDHIGSTDCIIQADWNSATGSWKAAATEPDAERQSFDAWGERRNGSSWADLKTSWLGSQYTSAVNENRGFTGHEMLDDFGLVHMNGRIYDPELGRFLSPDPYVQMPEFSQNFNRYSYVLNNPLSHTDSTGHFIDWIVAGIYAAVSAVASATSAGIAVGAAVGGAIAGTAGAVIGGLIGGAIGLVAGVLVPAAFMQGAGGLAVAGNLLLSAYNIGSQISAGASWGDILRGVGVSFVAAAITVGLSTGGCFDSYLFRAAGHGLIQGSANEAMGGRFQDGFIGAAAGSLLPALQVFPGPVGGAINRGLIGGTASVIGGGKFANGALGAVAAYLFDRGTLGADEENQNEVQGRWIHPFGDASRSKGVSLHGILGDQPDADYQEIADRAGRSIFHIYSEGGLSGGVQDVLEVAVNRGTLGFGSKVTTQFLRGYEALPAAARLDIQAHSQGTTPVTYAMLRKPWLFQGAHFTARSPAVYRAEIALAAARAGATYQYIMPSNDIARLYATLNPIGHVRFLMNPVAGINNHLEEGRKLPGF